MEGIGQPRGYSTESSWIESKLIAFISSRTQLVIMDWIDIQMMPGSNLEVIRSYSLTTSWR